MTDQTSRPTSNRDPNWRADGEPRLPADRTSAGPLPAPVGPPAPAASILLFAGFFALIGLLVVLGTLAEGIRDQEVYTLDQIATPFLHAAAAPALDAIMNAATFAGSSLCIVPLFLLAIVVLLRIGRPGAAAFLSVASVGSLLINVALKLFFQRPRPQVPWAHVLPDYSFPSGHTMNSVAFYVGLAIIVWSISGRHRGAIALVAAIILCMFVGISRIYLGYHYFTDVLGGVLAGASWLLIALAAFRSKPLARFWSGPEREPATTARPPARRS